MQQRWCPAVAFVLAMSWLTIAPALASDPFRDGLAAYNRGDFDAAMLAWLPLAERGDPPSQAGVGFLFMRGLGMKEDDAEAAHWFAKAAEHGQAEAQLLLGRLYVFGQGVPQSYVSAFAWCELATGGGQSDAQSCRDAALEAMPGDAMTAAFRVATQLRERIDHERREQQ
jgi:TPR repeat protein